MCVEWSTVRALVNSGWIDRTPHTNAWRAPHTDRPLRTNGSLTARQATTSTPNDLISSTFSKKPGRCFSEQVGVNAPGTAKRTLLFPRKMSSIITSASSGSVLTRADGMGLPLLSFIRSRLRWWWWWCL